MKVVVLAGPESSGKSWLAAQLHAHFGGLMVGEYVRYFIDQHQRDTTLAGIPAIAQGQLAWEDAARAKRPALLILDTHLLTNRLWNQTLFGDYPGWLDDELLARHYDLPTTIMSASLSNPADQPILLVSASQRASVFKEVVLHPFESHIYRKLTLAKDGAGLAEGARKFTKEMLFTLADELFAVAVA